MYDRKSNTCPECGKKILKVSKLCRGCSQKGKLNHRYIDGSKSPNRFCTQCGDKITPGSLTGICQKCYLSNISKENNPNYKDGKYLRDFYNTEQYREWRQRVYKRDKYTCQVCGFRKRGGLDAHHIIPKRNAPELTYDINNGITLCKACHQKTYQKEISFVDLFVKIIAEVKFREFGEPCDGNAEPNLSNQEGVETRGEIRSSMSAGERSERIENIVRP